MSKKKHNRENHNNSQSELLVKGLNYYALPETVSSQIVKILDYHLFTPNVVEEIKTHAVASRIKDLAQANTPYTPNEQDDTNIDVNTRTALQRIKNVLDKYAIVDGNITNVELSKYIKSAYFIHYSKIIHNNLVLDNKDTNNQVYNIFMKYQKQPSLQHIIGKIIYKEEIINKVFIFNGPPYTQKGENILNERLNNLNKYKRYLKNLNLNASRNYSFIDKNQLGLSYDTTIEDILNSITSSRSLTNQTSKIYVLGHTQLQDMLNTKKYLLCKPFYEQSQDKCLVRLSYYIGIYKDSPILFLERIYYDPFNRVEISPSYSFGFFAGDLKGDHQHYVNLLRTDSNFNSYFSNSHYDQDTQLEVEKFQTNHYNKLESNQPLNNKSYKQHNIFDANVDYKIKNTEASYHHSEETKLKDLINEMITNGKDVNAEMKDYMDKVGEGKETEYKTNIYLYKTHIHINSDVYSTIFAGAPGTDAINVANKNVFNKSYNDLYKYSKEHNIRDREDLVDFINRMSIEEVPDFEHLVKLMKNITKTTSNENVICKDAKTVNEVTNLNQSPCLDQTIFGKTTKINASILQAYNDFIQKQEEEGEINYEN